MPKRLWPRYLLAALIPIIGPWIIWPGAELCEQLWGKAESFAYFIVTLLFLMAGIAVSCDRLPHYKYLFVLVQFFLFWASIFGLIWVGPILS